MNSTIQNNNNYYVSGVAIESDVVVRFAECACEFCTLGKKDSDSFAADVTSSAETALNMQVMKNKIDDNVCLLLGDKESDCEQDEQREGGEDNIASWEQFLSVETEMEKLDHYKNCKLQLQQEDLWSPTEIQIFKDYIADYESNHQKQIRYEEGVSLWAQYGLSKENYDAHIVYDNACADLEYYYNNRDYEDEQDDEYENSLKTIIETFEAEIKEAEEEQERLDNENDWWVSSVPSLDEEDDEEDEEDDEEDEEDDEEVSFEDWMESRKEEVAQFERENAMDDRSSF